MDAIRYTTNVADLASVSTDGFFVGWPTAPSEQIFRLLLANSAHVVLAIDDDTSQLVGFINAHSDGVLSAYVPLLEVLPAFQGQGIGSTLVTQMLNQLQKYYMVDLTCEDKLVPFYERFTMMRLNAMAQRDFRRIPLR